MFSKRDRASNQQISVFKQDDELASACRVGLTLPLRVGDGLPAVLYCAANPVLVVLSEAMPERRYGSAALRLWQYDRHLWWVQRRGIG